jgi:hypothetical protein
MAQQTAVEWLFEQLVNYISYDDDRAFKQHEDIIDIVNKAKAMEKEQMIRFAIACHQDILTSRNAPEHLIAENLILFEQYYSKIYGK